MRSPNVVLGRVPAPRAAPTLSSSAASFGVSSSLGWGEQVCPFSLRTGMPWKV